MKYLSVLLAVCIIIMVCITVGRLIEEYSKINNKSPAEHKHSKSRIVEVDGARVLGNWVSIIRVDSTEFLLFHRGGVVELK